MLVRRLSEDDDLDAFGRLVRDAYQALPGYVGEPDYELELLDVRTRNEVAEVVGAFDDDEAPLGCVTYVPDTEGPLAEHADPEAAGIRMLAVAVHAQRRGAGEALVRWCVERARADGKSSVVLHTTTWMPAAHRLYDRLGFERAPDLDWEPLPDLPLLGYRHRLRR